MADTEDRLRLLALQNGCARYRCEQITTEINLARRDLPGGFLELPNTVYLPTSGRRKAVTTMSDLVTMPRSYLQLRLNPERADARYVARFLNSELGLAIRRSVLSDAVISRMTKASARRLEFYLPPPDVQHAEVSPQG